MKLQVETAAEQDQPLLRPLRLLAIGSQKPDWEFLQQRMNRQQWELKQVDWNPDLFTTLQMLRKDHWDCLVIYLHDTDEQISHRELAAFLSAIRESGLSIAILGLASYLDVELVDIFQNFQCDFHESGAGWFSPAIGAMISRTMQLQATAHQYQKLRNKEQLRHLREQEEAELILTQQRTLLQGILQGDNLSKTTGNQTNASLFQSDSQTSTVDPDYEQTLRSFVIMGAGKLEGEISQLVLKLQSQGITPRDLLAMHLASIEQLISGLGKRSSRHVVQRADQMLLEIMIHLAENYRSDAA